MPRLIVSIIIILLSLFFSCEEKKDYQKLIGKWVRPDGGYTLEITAVNEPQITAGYYNPGKINISNAEIRKVNDKEEIYIEFFDTNYMGSYYKLIFDQNRDQLIGTYYQATLKQTYNIYFVKMK